ncbi:hypothetical protein ACFQPC_06665 [Herminiimonas glaciei]|uniref:Uncharacterized protein n=1 Tax=Herminiimonas glaciei TaxID=523788 RepID=A0ABW2I9U5_9BURK
MPNSFFIFIKSSILFLVGLGFLFFLVVALRMFVSSADEAALSLYLGAAALGFLSLLILISALITGYTLPGYQEQDSSQDAEQPGHDSISNEQQAFDAFLRCRVMCAYQTLPTISEPI